MVVLALAIMGLVNIACFIIGAKVGQAVQQCKDIELKLPTARPTEKKTEKQNRFDILMENVDNYDGTPFGQKEVR